MVRMPLARHLAKQTTSVCERTTCAKPKPKHSDQRTDRQADERRDRQTDRQGWLSRYTEWLHCENIWDCLLWFVLLFCYFSVFFLVPLNGLTQLSCKHVLSSLKRQRKEQKLKRVNFNFGCFLSRSASAHQILNSIWLIKSANLRLT